MIDVWLLLNTYSGRPFRIRTYNSAAVPPREDNTMMSFRQTENLIKSETVHDRRVVIIIN